MKKLFLTVFFFMIFVSTVSAGTLSQSQVERVKAVRALLAGVDNRTLQDTISELANSKFPEGNLEIMEAIAATYQEMVSEYQVEGQAKKEWLHSMVCLNMAYLQAGGIAERSDTGLNMVIRRKLKKYLSPQLLSDPELFYSVE